MDKKQFVLDFVDLFDELAPTEVTQETVLRDLDDWSSMIALSLLNMIEKEYLVSLSSDELRHSITVGDLCEMIENKQKQLGGKL